MRRWPKERTGTSAPTARRRGVLDAVMEGLFRDQTKLKPGTRLRARAGHQVGAVELVAGVDQTDRAGGRAHREGLGQDLVGPEADPAQELAVGDAGGGEEHVVPPDQVVDGQDLVEVVAGVEGGPALVLVAGPQAAVHGAAEALEGAGGDHALWGAADADGHVDPGLLPGGHDGPGGVPADSQLLHVDARAGVEHGAPLGQGDHGDGVGEALGGQGGAVDRVDGDVDLGRAAAADPLAVVEHGGVVLLALADHHHPVHGDLAQHRAHGVHGRLVDLLLVAAAQVPGPADGRRLGRADQLERQVAVGLGHELSLFGHGEPPGDDAMAVHRIGYGGPGCHAPLGAGAAARAGASGQGVAPGLPRRVASTWSRARRTAPVTTAWSPRVDMASRGGVSIRSGSSRARMRSQNRSPSSATAPEITTSSGLSIPARAATTKAIRSATWSTISRASSSPARAASRTVAVWTRAGSPPAMVHSSRPRRRGRPRGPSPATASPPRVRTR